MEGGDAAALSVSISDGMVLVAATAVGIAGFRLTARELNWDLADLRFWDVWGRGALDWAAFALGTALLVIRLRAPRPDRDRLWRQPGWLASLGAAATAVLDTADALVGYALQEAMQAGSSGYDLAVVFHDILPLSVPPNISRVVIVIWGMLALSGRWTAERSAVDRLGRAIGWYWVIRGVLSPLLLLATY